MNRQNIIALTCYIIGFAGIMSCRHAPAPVDHSPIIPIVKAADPKTPLPPSIANSPAPHIPQSSPVPVPSRCTPAPLSGVAASPAIPAAQSLYGICFSPYRSNQNPDCGVFPTREEIRQELQFIRNSDLAPRIRTYSCMGSLVDIPELCRQMGLECWPGAWLSRYRGATERELQALITVGRMKLPNTPVLIVGNEVLLRNDMSERELIKAIIRVKHETGLPIAYADVGGMWDQHPEVARYVDVILVHLYPYWDGHSIDGAIDALLEQWRKLVRDHPDKRIVIGETGWPLAGELNGIGSSYTGIVQSTTGHSPGEAQGMAVPSPKNQARYLHEFIQASQANRLEYFYFSLFCEAWKAKQEGTRGANWGLFLADGTINPSLGNLLPPKARPGMKRRPGCMPPSPPLSLPAYIYRDGGSIENRFFPTAYMGDTRALQIDEYCTHQPKSGKDCLQINYITQGNAGWAGIYWIGPYMNHWGEYPGYRAEGCRQLVFWSRGEHGGEQVEFKIGGINSPGMPFRDSFGPLPQQDAKQSLSKDWTRYSINLEGADISSLLSGFCMVVNQADNPRGCTIYLDDIVLDGQ
jgi:exo-beta-1,3-glucanase (GH17 family)